MRIVMLWLVWCLTLIGLAGCDDGNEEALSCSDDNACTRDSLVDGECLHQYQDYISSPDYCTFHPETCVDATLYRWRPEREIKLDCAWISQLSDEADVKDVHNLKCGRTSLVMAAACIDGYTPEYSEVLGLVEWMKEFIPSYDPDGTEIGTYPYQLEDAAKGYYGLSAQSFGYDGRDMLTLKDVYEDLQQGLPVLVSVDGQDICNLTDVMKKRPFAGHAELLVGITPTHIILNDPGALDIALGRNRQYTIESFLTVWQGGVRFRPKRL